MFNKRSFLMGLGVGIILGAVLLQLIHMSEDMQTKLESMGELQEAAEQEESVPPVQPTAAADEDRAASDAALALEPQETTEALDTAEETEPAPPGDESELDPASGQGAASAIGRKIRIEPGMSLTRSAQLLEDNGIIDDPAGFIKEMRTLNKQVRAGYYYMQEGISVDQAIEIVTSQPLTKEELESMQ